MSAESSFLRILPTLTLLLICSLLDRTNVGNAKIIGFERDINITNHQYNIGLAVFFVTYIASEIPSNLVLKKISPSIWLPFLTFWWGIFAMCLGFIRNFAGFVGVRALLGLAEGGLMPGIVLYLSCMYTRGEMALRIGLFYTASSLSGAFGGKGLLARGLSAIGPRGGLEGWRWIFIIEGLMTVAAAALAYIVLPNNIETASFLKPEEREQGKTRLLLDKPGAQVDENGNLLCSDIQEEAFSWSEVKRGIFSLQVWFTAPAYFAILSGMYSFGLFLPTIIKDGGFASNPDDAQLWSVIPYAVAATVTVFIAFLSDHINLRGPIMLCTLPLAIAGYAAIANVSSATVKYGVTFLMAIGMFSTVPCLLAWLSNNSAGHYKRATSQGLQLSIANCGGFVATFIYPTKEKPQYHKGHTIVMSLLIMAWFMILFNVLNCMRINRDKTNGKYDQFAGAKDDRDPGFKMIL